MDVNTLVQTVAIYAPPVLFAITLHEAAHGYVARHFGDLTAHAQGRISANPLRHIDWLGTIVVPLLVLYFSSWKFVFGWAKPVPVNYSALQSPRRTTMGLVAAAGPAANLVMLLLWGVILRFSVDWSAWLAAMAEAGVVANLVLMAVNLLPILPLDGGRILLSLLPRGPAARFARFEQWTSHLLTAVVLFAVFDGMANDGKLLARTFAPLGGLAHLLVRVIAYG
ncbi:MAG TPA: site-2 protease family protein [Burkholderiales bacterium]|nr:site-2 protease family protein [Burkholderiales bacterium]